MAKDFVKVITVMICINILLFVGGVRVIEDNDVFMNRFIDTNTYRNSSQVITSNQLENSVNQPLVASGTGVLDFIDSIGAVTSFISFLINIIFTPLGLFMGGGLPAELTLIVGIPMLGLLVLGVAYFIRSGA